MVLNKHLFAGIVVDVAR